MSGEEVRLNPLAVEANETIEREAPAVMRMLSDLGKALYFPKGILTQSAEANQKAYRYNATIGEAREEQHSMACPRWFVYGISARIGLCPMLLRPVA